MKAAVMHAEEAAPGVGGDRRGRHAHGLALTAAQHRSGVAHGLVPDVVGVANERALRRADAAQLAAEDRHVAPHLDHPGGAATGDLFLVVVALVVAVVDARDRGVAPVDDLHVVLAIDEAALADQHVAGLTLLAQGHVREVRRRDIDRQRARAAQAAANGRQAGHLLDQGRQILGLGLGDHVAEADELLVEIVGVHTIDDVFLPEDDAGLDPAVETFLVGDDGRARRPGLHWLGHGEMVTLIQKPGGGKGRCRRASADFSRPGSR